MKKIKLLFQGDSITDAGRNYDDIHDLGLGYPKYAAKYLEEKYPDKEFEFIDLGISRFYRRTAGRYIHSYRYQRRMALRRKDQRQVKLARRRFV